MSRVHDTATVPRWQPPITLMLRFHVWRMWRGTLDTFKAVSDGGTQEEKSWQKKPAAGLKFRQICAHWRKRAWNKPSRLSISSFQQRNMLSAAPRARPRLRKPVTKKWASWQ